MTIAKIGKETRQGSCWGYLAKRLALRLIVSPFLLLQELGEYKDGLAVYPTLHVRWIFFRKTDASNSRTSFYHHGGAFHFKVFDNGHVVTVKKLVPIAIHYLPRLVGRLHILLRPRVKTLRAVKQGAIKVGDAALAFNAIGCLCHVSCFLFGYIILIPRASHSSRAISRRRNFCILPLPVIGNSSTKKT